MVAVTPHLVLTNSPKGATFMSIGKRFRESRLPRKDEIMKLTSTACRADTHAHQIHTTNAGSARGPKELARKDRQADGRIGLAGRGSALAQVHKPESGARPADGRAYVVRNGGSVGTRPADDRAHPRSDACHGRDDRVGQVVSHAGRAPASLPQPLTAADPLSLVPRSWRDNRASKPSLTVTPELFEVAGCRAAEHWLANRPTANPSQWRRSTFENLVAGLGRIPAYADCCAAFERSFKRRIEAASHTDRKATEVRA